MPRRFHVSARVDEDRRRIIFTINGEIDSAALMAKWREVYSELAEPWRYDRLFDYRRADGLVDYDEVVRFADWWRDRTRSAGYSSKVAVVVNNPLDLARVHVVGRLFPYEVRESFFTFDEALTWLDGQTQRASA